MVIKPTWQQRVFDVFNAVFMVFMIVITAYPLSLIHILSEFDEYIETAYEKGVGKALEIYNNAYNEYLTKQR